MTDLTVPFTITILIILVVVLTLRDTSLKREIGRLSLQKFSLVDKMRELGVHVTEDKKSFSGLAYRYTEAASNLLRLHYYPSSWNLERQLDLEAYMARQDAEAEDKARDAVVAEGEKALEALERREDSISLREAILKKRDEEWHPGPIPGPPPGRPSEGGPQPFQPPDIT